MLALQPVTGSTQIKAFVFDPLTQVLSVQFHNSAFVYHYREVPVDVAREFEKAESKGKAFGQLIRGKFDFSRVNTAAGDDDEAEPIALKDGSAVDTRTPWPTPASA